MGSLVAELAEKLSSATNNFDIDSGTIYVNTSADTVAIGGTSPDGKFSIHQSASADILNLYDGTDVVFSVLDGGNVGIGTSAPSTKLDFGVTSAGDNIITLRKNSNSVIGIGVGTGFGVKVFAPSDGTASNLMFETGLISTGDGTTFTQRGLAVTFIGNVGIGTSGPNMSGFSTGASAATILTVKADGAGDNPAVLELVCQDATGTGRHGEIRFGNTIW